MKGLPQNKVIHWFLIICLIFGSLTCKSSQTTEVYKYKSCCIKSHIEKLLYFVCVGLWRKLVLFFILWAYGPQGLNPGYWAWQQVPLPSESSLQAQITYFNVKNHSISCKYFTILKATIKSRSLERSNTTYNSSQYSQMRRKFTHRTRG